MYKNKTWITMMTSLMSFLIVFETSIVMLRFLELSMLMVVAVSIAISIVASTAMYSFSGALVSHSNPLYFVLEGKEMLFLWSSDLETKVSYRIHLDKELGDEEEKGVRAILQKAESDIQTNEKIAQGFVHKLGKETLKRSEDIIVEAMKNIIMLLIAAKTFGSIEASNNGSWKSNPKKSKRLEEFAII